MWDLTQIFLGKEESETLRNRFVRSATGVFGLNIAFNGLLFVISVILARLLGSAGYGAYAYALSWILVLGIAADLGLGGLLTRNIASYQTRSAWGLMTGLMEWAKRTVLFTSSGIALLSAVVLWILRTHLDPQILFPLLIALILLPLTALMRIRRTAMQGLYHLVLGQLPEMLFHPLLFIVLIGVVYLFVEGSITASWAVGMNIVATGAALIISMKLLRKVFPQSARNASPVYETRTWLSSGLFMMLVGGLHIINSRTDILMLGAIKGAEAVGIYHAASRGAELIMLVLMPIHLALGPTVAGLYAEKNYERLQRIVTKITRLILLLSLPIMACLLIFGYWFLLLFGPDFTRGQIALSILSIGNLIHIALGPVALLLLMTRYERDATVGVGIGALLNVILNAFFIPIWGLEGAAIATVISKISWNVLMAIWVYKRLKIHPTVLGRISLRRGV